MFCSVCDSLLNISISDNPNSAKNKDSDNLKEKSPINMNDIIDKLFNDEKYDFSDVNLETISSSDEYMQLSKDKKTKLNKKIEQLQSARYDNSSNVFMHCRLCSESYKMKPITLISSKINERMQSSSYYNSDRYKNNIYNRILPRTKNYVCPNDKCPGIKNEKLHEAVFDRIGDSMKVMYTCVGCQEYWIGY
jgi:hypothetical protein